MGEGQVLVCSTGLLPALWPPLSRVLHRQAMHEAQAARGEHSDVG